MGLGEYCVRGSVTWKVLYTLSKPQFLNFKWGIIMHVHKTNESRKEVKCCSCYLYLKDEGVGY